MTVKLLEMFHKHSIVPSMGCDGLYLMFILEILLRYNVYLLADLTLSVLFASIKYLSL